MRLAENTERKKSAKIRHLRTISQLCRDISSQLRHVSAIGKKLLNSNISPTSLQYGELRLRSVRYFVSKFQRVSRLGSVEAKFHYAILVADRSESGRRPVASWNLAYH